MVKHFLSFVILILFSVGTIAQENQSCEEEHIEFIKEQNEHFADEEATPLPDKDKKGFEFVNYYTYDSNYCVEATWVRTPDEEPFEMPTSTERLPMYVKYGELHFELEGEQLKLAVYQNGSLIEEEGYEDYLFIPFNDLTNGVSSYGGGRYMDMRIPTSETLHINLNNSYHPYCAYSPLYSCPIPPKENMLDVAIEAGVKIGLNGRSAAKH